MPPPVTIAVVSWNTRELLTRCLGSMGADADAGRCDVWVVDNASSDGSAEMVRTEFDWVHLIESETNLGFGPAVNAVAARTDSEWIAPANADVALEPGALEALLAFGESNPGAGTIAPRLVLPDGTTQHSVHSFPTISLAALFATGLPQLSRRLGDRLLIEGRWNPERPRRIDWAHGAFLLVRRRAFDAVGGFDEEQWMYAEDLDLAWRLGEQGWHSYYEPAARVRHEVSAATSKAFGDERADRAMAAAYAWMRRRRGRTVTRITAFFNLIGAAVRLILAAPRGRARAQDAFRYVQMHARGLA